MNPNDAQLRAQSELQSGESLYWTGTADPRRAAIAALPPHFSASLRRIRPLLDQPAYRATSSMSRSTNNSFVHGFQVFPFSVCRFYSSD